MAEERVERRLAAILCADVAGYSRLMGADEEGTLAALKSHRRELIDPLIAQHKGPIVKTTGDGMLVEFASVVDAVRCAVVLQQGMADRNANLPEGERIRFRIGINLGDVIVDEGDLFGDGVNVAARLEALAQPAEICVSASVREQVGEKLPIGFADLGEHEVKNIVRPVRVYRVDARAEPTGPAAADTPLALPDRPSIAVLPFANLSGDPEQDYFVDGMVEDIITGLSRIKWLFVIARNSSFAYKGKFPDVRQVGRELGVRYVLEGSVRKAAGRVRITGQLVEAVSGRHIWAERYDRPLDDIFALQDEITLSVVGAIEPSLRRAEIERVRRKRPEHLGAYDLVLRATPFVETAMADGASQALPLLERALALEPDYALAHSHAAVCHEILFMRGRQADRREENRQGAIRHARAALVHGRDDATALAEAGFVIAMVEHDRAAAREAFEAATVLSPSSAFTYIMGSVVLGWAGEGDRAIEWAEKGLRLSPLDPWNFNAWFGVFAGNFQQARYEDAANAARKSVQSNPGFSIPHICLASALVKLGRIDEAKAAATRVLELQPGFRIGEWCAAIEPAPNIAAPLTEALRIAGLPA